MNRLKQIKDIKNGNGLHYLLDAAKRIFLNPLSIADMNLRLIASTDDDVYDFMWNEMTSTYARGIKARDFLADNYCTEEEIATPLGSRVSCPQIFEKCGRKPTLSTKSESYVITSEYIMNSDKYAFFKSGEIKYARMVSYIYNKKNDKVGLLSMYEYYTPFDDEIQEAFELFTDKISCELRNGKHFIKLGSAFHDDVFNKLRYAGRIKSYC